MSNRISNISRKRHEDLLRSKKIRNLLSYFTEWSFSKVYLYSSTFDTYIYFKIKKWPSRKHLMFCMSWKGVQYSPGHNLTVLLKNVIFIIQRRRSLKSLNLSCYLNCKQKEILTVETPEKNLQKLPSKFNVWHSQKHRVGQNNLGETAVEQWSNLPAQASSRVILKHIAQECVQIILEYLQWETPKPL